MQNDTAVSEEGFGNLESAILINKFIHICDKAFFRLRIQFSNRFTQGLHY